MTDIAMTALQRSNAEARAAGFHEGRKRGRDSRDRKREAMRKRAEAAEARVAELTRANEQLAELDRHSWTEVKHLRARIAELEEALRRIANHDGSIVDYGTPEEWMRGYAVSALNTETGHASDCSLHNEPAFPTGPCDCEVPLQQEDR